MPIVWNILCATSGDICVLGGAKSPVTASSECRLALCTETPCLEAVRTEMFCYHLFHALKCSSFIKTLRRAVKAFCIILLESQKRKLKIKFPCCSQGMSTSYTFVIWHHKEFQGRLFQAGRTPRSGSSGFRTCAWLTFMILFVLSNGAERKALQWA